MKFSQSLQIGMTALLGAGSFVALGCGGIDQTGTDSGTSDNVETQSAALTGHHWHPPQRGGAAGSSATGGGGTTSGSGSALGGATGGSDSSALDCSICTTTQQCCEAVSGGALCTFSAATCASLDPQRQIYYAQDCLMVLRTAISAYTMNQRSAPSACALPAPN